MTTVIDTNVLVSFWETEEPRAIGIQNVLDAALSAGPLVCPAPVFAELMASPSRSAEFLAGFFHDVGIRVDWHITEPVWRMAGTAYQGYAKRRRQNAGGLPRRILADFVIGAYASHHRARLLTLDQKTYRAAFPHLPLMKA